MVLYLNSLNPTKSLCLLIGMFFFSIHCREAIESYRIVSPYDANANHKKNLVGSTPLQAAEQIDYPLFIHKNKTDYSKNHTLDILATFNGAASIRHQYGTASNCTLITDFMVYFSPLDTTLLLIENHFNNLNLHLEKTSLIALGTGVSFWLSEKFHNGYISLQSHALLQNGYLNQSMQMQQLLLRNTIEIGTRFQSNSAAIGLSGGIGYQVPIYQFIELTELQQFAHPVIIAYFGLHFGLAF